MYTYGTKGKKCARGDAAMTQRGEGAGGGRVTEAFLPAGERKAVRRVSFYEGGTCAVADGDASRHLRSLPRGWVIYKLSQGLPKLTLRCPSRPYARQSTRQIRRRHMQQEWLQLRKRPSFSRSSPASSSPGPKRPSSSARPSHSARRADGASPCACASPPALPGRCGPA